MVPQPRRRIDAEVTVEEMEHCIKTMKQGKSGGSDSLGPEDICYGGEFLNLWLVKIFN